MPTQFFDIILLAMIAAFVAFRLYSVLGRRTGHERSPDEVRDTVIGRRSERAADAVGAKNPPAKDNIVTLPERPAQSTVGATPVARGLMDIKLKDRRFDEDSFMQGARAAHEMIVTAFARSDRETLRPLVSDDVYAAFEGAMAGREQRNERVDFSFEGLKGAGITGAELKDQIAEVTVAFESDIILAAYDPHGRLVEGDPKHPHRVTDIWTFARDLKSRDPNWTLVATSSG